MTSHHFQVKLTPTLAICPSRDRKQNLPPIGGGFFQRVFFPPRVALALRLGEAFRALFQGATHLK